MRSIDADALRETMYHEAFEKDNDMQKWDSGCWIRYKLFEKCIEAAPTIDTVPVVRCKDCKYSEHWYRDKKRCFFWCEVGIGVFEDGFCSYGERSKNEK
jgi:hypothetical protein